jgi:phosphotransferase system enzyme I (PtsI)
VGARLATVDLATCRRAAEAALAQDDPASARSAVREALAAVG